ncbi:MAG: prolyl oligopeptidase family serine peptidase, partial [Elusimicrobia bacterium]|nr:prolyl oligopeptidase family serine peptidase [Elusimicrobiota bacterium]
MSLREAKVADLTTLAGIDPEAALIAPPPPFRKAPERPVPGTLVEGELPEDTARFVLRLPESWNGGLVVAAAPGLLGERSLDLYWSDFCVARGFAFACTDKGARIGFVDGRFVLPSGEGCRIRRWYPRLKALAELASARCGRPEAVFAVGVSNGGYLARCAMERDPELFSGGVDVSGPLWRADEPTLLRELPLALAGPDASALDAEYRPIRALTLRALLDD